MLRGCRNINKNNLDNILDIEHTIDDIQKEVIILAEKLGFKLDKYIPLFQKRKGSLVIPLKAAEPTDKEKKAYCRSHCGMYKTDHTACRYCDDWQKITKISDPSLISPLEAKASADKSAVPKSEEVFCKTDKELIGKVPTANSKAESSDISFFKTAWYWSKKLTNNAKESANMFIRVYNDLSIIYKELKNDCDNYQVRLLIEDFIKTLKFNKGNANKVYIKGGATELPYKALSLVFIDAIIKDYEKKLESKYKMGNRNNKLEWKEIEISWKGKCQRCGKETCVYTTSLNTELICSHCKEQELIHKYKNKNIDPLRVKYNIKITNIGKEKNNNKIWHAKCLFTYPADLTIIKRKAWRNWKTTPRKLFDESILEIPFFLERKIIKKLKKFFFLTCGREEYDITIGYLSGIWSTALVHPDNQFKKKIGSDLVNCRLKQKINQLKEAIGTE